MSDAMDPDVREVIRRRIAIRERDGHERLLLNHEALRALLDAADERDRLVAVAPCSETHTAPFDFAYCSTHDRTFALGDHCDYAGLSEVGYLERQAREQRVRAMRAEDERDRLAAAVNAHMLSATSPDADRILRLRRLATQPIDTPDGDAILVADVLDILDDNHGPDELDRLRVTVQRVRQACQEDTQYHGGFADGWHEAHADILTILESDHG